MLERIFGGWQIPDGRRMGDAETTCPTDGMAIASVRRDRGPLRPLVIGADEFRNELPQFLGSEWFGQKREICGVMAHETRAAGHKEKRRVVSPVPPQPRPELQAGAIRQIEITNHDIKWPVGEHGMSGFSNCSGSDRRVAPALKQLRQQFSHFRFVVNQQDSRNARAMLLLRRGPKPLAWHGAAMVVGNRGIAHAKI